MEPTDILYTQILNLETLRDLLMSNDKSMQLDPHGISSLMDGIVDGLKYAHDELLDVWKISTE